MSPRIQRLATDWKTYAALVGVVSAAITAFTGLFNQLKDSIQALHDLPAQAKWVAVLILALLALFAAIAAWSRRSILLRPDRFIVSSDEPEQLKGRTIEVEALAKDCEDNPLVFLEGESGTGKSALVRAGLAAFLRNPAENRQLIPVLLDASSLSWTEGLRIQLSRAVATLSPEDRAELGATEQLGIDDVFTEIGALPSHAACRLLLILDQVDDYLVAHRTYMLRENRVLTADEFVQANPNWGALAALIRKGRLHLLLVCRNDIFSRLDSFRFAKVATFTLWRIDQQLISPLLDQVTQDVGKGPVVENPEYGWLQLKSRLLRDLSAGTQHILPIQLAVALDSLRRFRILTIGEYGRNGGARGLERLHIERHLAEIARSRRINEGALLRGLMLLVTEGGHKTQRATREAFCNAVLEGAPRDTDLGPVIEHFERWRILRHQLSDDGEYLLLHHDFLARGVWEAHRQANRWAELLRQRGREFEDALTWFQRWRTLLPPTTQLQLIYARVCGRFRFGEHRAFASWSVFRFVPVFAFLACLCVGYIWADVMRQEQFAEGIFASLGDTDIDENEAQDWAALASAKEDARIRAVQRGLAKPAVEARLSQKALILVHTVIGLDPTGQHNRRFALEIVLPTIRDYQIKNRGLSVVTQCAPLLRLGPDEVRNLTTALVDSIKTEKDEKVLYLLVEALGSLGEKLETNDARAAAAVLVERMKTEKTSQIVSLLGRALGALSGKLEAEDVQGAVTALVEQMKTEKDSKDLSFLGRALGSFSGKIEARNVQPAVAILVEQMKAEKDDEGLHWLVWALNTFTEKLETKDVQAAAALLVARIKIEEEDGVLSNLTGTLSSLAGKLEPKDVQPAAAALVERIISGGTVNFYWSVEALGVLSEKLEAEDIQPLVAPLVEQMKTTKDVWRLSIIGNAVRGLSRKLEAKDVQPAVVAVIEQMKSEKNSQRLPSLGKILGSLSAKLEAKEVQPAVAVLVEQMKTEKNSERLSSLGEALGSFSGRLEAKDIQPAVTALVERMKIEKNSGFLLSLGEALGSLSAKVETKDVQPAAVALVEQMKIEKDSGRLSSLGNVLGSLSPHLSIEDAQAAIGFLSQAWKREHGMNASTKGWVRLEAVAERDNDLHRRVQKYVDLLALPLVLRSERNALLDGLESLLGAKFDGDLWRFVEWATTTDKGRSMHLKLEHRGH